MIVVVDQHWRVRGEAHLDLPFSAQTAWGQVRDWTRFLLLDPLHAQITRQPATPFGTEEFLILHRLAGFSITRVGRLLAWREERGYAVSDLSLRGPRSGFPHICTYEVLSVSEHECRLVVGVRGRWTARWMPRWMVRAWIAWVLLATKSVIRAELSAFARWRRSAVIPPQTAP